MSGSTPAGPSPKPHDVLQQEDPADKSMFLKQLTLEKEKHEKEIQEYKEILNKVKAENASLYKQVVELQEKNVELQKRFYFQEQRINDTANELKDSQEKCAALDVELNLERVIQEKEVIISTLTETNKQILEKCRKTKLQILAVYEGMNSEESVIQEEDSSKKITHLESSSQEINRIISTLSDTVQKLPDALCNFETEVTSKTEETYDKKVKKMKKLIKAKFDTHVEQFQHNMETNNKLLLPEKTKEDIQEGLAEGDGDSLLSGTTGRLRPQVQDGFEVN